MFTMAALWGRTSRAAGEAMRILLADDDPKIHLIISLWLRRKSHDLEAACNGRQALARLQEGGFEGLIADVNMPLMNGVQLVHAALELPAPPRLIVLLTSRCDLPQLRREIDSPRVHFFNKPFSPQALADLIEDLARATEAREPTG
jgi:CheY-like chemotaxis protein